MNKDLLNLVISVAASVIGIASTFYQQPAIGLAALAAGVVAYLIYLGYQVHMGTPGNIVLRLSPVLLLFACGGAMYWFWPPSLKVVLYTDLNSNGRRDKGEPAIPQEPVGITDANSAQRSEYTDGDGEIQIAMPRGEYRLKIRNFQIMGDVDRGQGRIYVGFPPVEDKTPPETRIFLGDELGIPVGETLQRRIFAHVWYHDAESRIVSVEIDWGDGKGWSKIDMDQPNLKYFPIQYEYREAGRKTIKLKVTNSAGLSSFPTIEPMRDSKDYAQINVRPQKSAGATP